MDSQRQELLKRDIFLVWVRDRGDPCHAIPRTKKDELPISYSLLDLCQNLQPGQFKIANGRFKQYEFTPDVTAYDGTTFYDYDLDGVFDCKVTMGSKPTFWLLVESQWCLLIPEGDLKGRVEVSGEWKRAVYADDQWRLEKSLNPEP